MRTAHPAPGLPDGTAIDRSPVNRSPVDRSPVDRSPVDRNLLNRSLLNRSLLTRQHLGTRTDAPVEQVVEHLVGLQAQNPSSPYTSLWSRVRGLVPERLGQALEERRLVRIAVMRGTIHLLTAGDALLLPGLLAPVLVGGLRANRAYASALRDVDLAELARAATDLVEDEPRTPADLGALLSRRWDAAPDAFAQAARAVLPLVQVTPRGVWGRSGATRWTTSRAWLGTDPVELTDPDVRDAALADLVVRYLRAFGPASVADVQTWCGLRRLAPVVDRLRPRLTVRRAEPGPSGRPGRELFDVPDAPQADEAPPPVRFLADFDNVLLSHADRSRIQHEAHRALLTSANGVTPGRVLLDGWVAGTWRIEVPPSRSTGASARTTLAVTLLPAGDGGRSGTVPADRDAIAAEATALVRYLRGPDVEHDVQVDGP